MGLSMSEFFLDLFSICFQAQVGNQNSSSFSWLYAIARPLINSFAKAAIADAVETGVRSVLAKVDESVAEVVGDVFGGKGNLEVQAREGKRSLGEGDGRDLKEWGSEAFSV